MLIHTFKKIISAFLGVLRDSARNKKVTGRQSSAPGVRHWFSNWIQARL